jgi:hypothetical protein
MSIEQDERIAIVDYLRLAQRRGRRLGLQLRFQGRTVQAEQVEAQTQKLASTIDVLSARAKDRWRGDPATTLRKMEAAQGELQGAIDAIQRKEDVSDNVAKALGQLDEIDDIGRSLLS